MKKNLVTTLESCFDSVFRTIQTASDAHFEIERDIVAELSAIVKTLTNANEAIAKELASVCERVQRLEEKEGSS